jgi:tetratricopeptide (TPR) repeat protein
LGPSSPMVARSLRNLADYYRRTGRAKEAVPLLKRAIAIYENTLGSASTEYLWCMDLLGITYTDLGNYKEAEHWLYPAYDMRLKAGGKDDPDYARALSNLGKLNYLRQEYVIAEKQLSVALSIFESKLGANSRDTGLTAMNLAEVYLRTNRLPEAEKYFRQAYTALKAVEPLSDNRIAATHKLMEVLEKLSKHDEAFALEEELTP